MRDAARWLRRLPLAAAAVMCAAAPAAASGGGGAPALRAVLLQREDAGSGELRIELDALTRELTTRHRWLRAGCPRQWDAACWDERTDRRTISPEALLAVVRTVSTLRTREGPMGAPPGESSVQVVVRTGDGRSRGAISTRREPDDAVLRLEAMLTETARDR